MAGKEKPKDPEALPTAEERATTIAPQVGDKALTGGVAVVATEPTPPAFLIDGAYDAL